MRGLVVFVCVGLMVGVAGVSSGSAAVGDTCESFAARVLPGPDNPLNADGVALTTDQVMAISGCYQASDGSWILPDGPYDARLRAPILSSVEAQRTQALRDGLTAQVAEFQAGLSPYLQAVLANIFVPERQPVLGNRNGDVPIDESAVQAYGATLVAFVQVPGHAALARYVVWWAQRRVVADQAWLASCLGSGALPAGCYGYEGQFEVRDAAGNPAPPWPWDLTDQVTLAAYAKWALAQGLIP